MEQSPRPFCFPIPPHFSHGTHMKESTTAYNLAAGTGAKMSALV
jgi:hypothetical protein